jgi:hypothetical protein
MKLGKLADNQELRKLQESLWAEQKQKEREARRTAKRYAPIPTIQNASVTKLVRKAGK